MIHETLEQLDLEKLKTKGRVLGLDHGLKRTGFAISDPEWKLALPFMTINTCDLFCKLQEIVQNYKTSLLVVGIPIALNGGKRGAYHVIVNDFCIALNKLFYEKLMEIEILKSDERLSTVACHKLLSSANVNLSLRKQTIDKLAAQFVLQGVLDHMQHKLLSKKFG